MPQAESTVKFWMEQCAAADLYIRPRFGLKTALDYLIGEKFINFLDSVTRHPRWRTDLEEFVAEIRSRFGSAELQEYMDEAMRGRRGSHRRRALFREARELLLPP